MVEFKKIGQKDFEKYPKPEIQKPPNRWEEVLAVLEGNGFVEIPVEEYKLRGVRIGLARSAATRGFKLEFRYANGHLAVGRSEEELPPREPKQRKPRAKKNETETA